MHALTSVLSAKLTTPRMSQNRQQRDSLSNHLHSIHAVNNDKIFLTNFLSAISEYSKKLRSIHILGLHKLSKLFLKGNSIPFVICTHSSFPHNHMYYLSADFSCTQHIFFTLQQRSFSSITHRNDMLTDYAFLI